MQILYLCDRRACKQCNQLCHHTDDVTHAVNFQPSMANVAHAGELCLWEGGPDAETIYPAMSGKYGYYVRCAPITDEA